MPVDRAQGPSWFDNEELGQSCPFSARYVCWPSVGFGGGAVSFETWATGFQSPGNSGMEMDFSHVYILVGPCVSWENGKVHGLFGERKVLLLILSKLHTSQFIKLQTFQPPQKYKARLNGQLLLCTTVYHLWILAPCLPFYLNVS